MFFQLKFLPVNPKEIYSPQFKQLEASFLQWLETLGYSPATIYTRRRNIKEFLLYLERSNVKTIEQATNNKVQLFVRYLSRRENKQYGSGLSNSTINVSIEAVNKFFDYLFQSQQLTMTIKKLSHIEENYKPRSILTVKEIQSLYDVTYSRIWFVNHGAVEIQEAVSQRDRAMLGIYYGCGLRKSEGINLDVEDILTDRKLILVRKGKGNKERYVPITANNLQYITEYLQDGRNYLLEKSEITTEALFINQYGEPCSAQGLSDRLKRLGKRAGIKIKPTLHMLRHSIATHLLQSGMEIELIQQFLGHSSLESTQIYTHIVNEF